MWKPGRSLVPNDEEDPGYELESVVTGNGSELEMRPLMAVVYPKCKVTAAKDRIQPMSAPGSSGQGHYSQEKAHNTFNIERIKQEILKGGSRSQMRRTKSLDTYQTFRADLPQKSYSISNSALSSPIQQQNSQEDSLIVIGNYNQRLNSQLLEAVEKQNIEEIVRLLKEGADPNATCRLNHVSACHIAALNAGEALSLLLDAGAKTDRYDKLGRTPLYWAAWAGNIKEIAILLDFSEEAEEEVKQLIPSICKMTNVVNNELPSAWMDGISHPCRDIEEHIPLSDPKWTPLHAASYFAQSNCVQLLLDAGADSDAKDLKGHIPLEVVGCGVRFDHIIDTKEFVETIKLLVKAVVNKNDLHIQGVKTYSPLHTAVELGSLEAIKLLLEAGVTTLPLNKDGLTPMHLCVQKELKEHLQLLANHLCTHKGSAIDCKDKDGCTVLLAAVISGWMPGICVPLAAGADITVKANNGQTALHAAAVIGNMDILNELLEYAKIRGVVDCLNEKKETALFIAVKEGHLECVKKLLRDGASIKHTLPKNTNVLHKAAEKGHLEILKFLFDSDPTATNDMINSPAKYEVYNAPPLHLAVMKNRSECVKLLLAKHADVNLTINKLYTPLNLAVQYGNLEIVKIILEFDKSTLTLMDDGWDALQFACHDGNRECIKMLLQQGADMSRPLTNFNPTTALSLIMENVNKPTEFMEDIFDSYINNNSFDLFNYVDYRMLTPNEEKGQMKVVDVLRSTGNRYDQKRLLLHPLIESFLYLKWKALLPFFYAILILYSIFVTSFTVLIMSAFSYKDSRKDAPAWMNTTIWSCVVCISVGLVVTLEIIYYMNIKSKTYFRHVETWVKFSAILLAVVLAPALAVVQPDVEWIRHLSSMALLVTWMEIMFLMSRFPDWGYYFLIFGTVALNILKILITFLFLLIGFTLGFMIQFKFEKPFTDFWSAVIKIVVMMNSEFDYGDLFEGKDSTEFATIISQIIFLVFVVLTAIVLMNLMVGVAVDDVHNLKLIGNINRIEKQIDLLSSLESLVYSNIFKKILPRSLHSVLQKKTRIPNILAILTGRFFSMKKEDGKVKETKEIVFPCHIYDSLFDIAIANEKRLENVDDSETFKTQIKVIYKAFVVQNEEHKISSTKLAAMEHKTNIIKRKLNDESISTPSTEMLF